LCVEDLQADYVTIPVEIGRNAHFQIDAVLKRAVRAQNDLQ